MKPLEIISPKNYLDYLKECCRTVEVLEQTMKMKIIGTTRAEKFVDKCELITRHTSRKTFMTLSLSFEVPRETLTAITGHQEDGRIVRKYLKIDGNLMLRQMDKAGEKLYKDPNGSEPEQLSEIDKLKKENEELKKMLQLQSK